MADSKKPTTAIEHLKAVLAAWDEPHYGDNDVLLDSVHEAIEPAREFLKPKPERPGAVCGACRHFQFDGPPNTDDPDLDLGRCGAMEGVTLPHAWRYSTREVMGVWRTEKSNCPLFLRAQGSEA